MTPGRDRFSARAVGDLQDIWEYTARKWSVMQADFYCGQIMELIGRLSLNPDSGRSIDHIRKDYLVAGFKAHFVFFRRTDTGIEIIRILHKRMDSISRLNDSMTE